MNNFFTQVHQVLRSKTPKEKIELFQKVYEQFKQNKLTFTASENIEVFSEPSYQSFCNIVDTKKVPQRKNLQDDEGKTVLLHAIAHIEYSAIDLALDACYRFQDMPKEFYNDWMEVADDEIRHYLMICDELYKYNVKYGDLPVHQGLFDASMKSLKLIPRMALIPRYMEANGLDANAMMIERLKKFLTPKV